MRFVTQAHIDGRWVDTAPESDDFDTFDEATTFLVEYVMSHDVENVRIVKRFDQVVVELAK